MGRILVIRGGAIGDFVLTLPVLAALRAAFPEARVEILGYPHIAQLAVAGGHAHAAHPIESRPLAGFFARNGTLDDRMAAFFAEFAVIVSYLFDPDDIFRTNVARCTRAQFIAGPHRPDSTGSRHATDVFLEPLQRLAIFDAPATPSLPLPPTPPGPGPNPWLAAHPGSGSDSKNWPESRWAELLTRVVHETHHNILLLGGEAEGDRLQRLASALPSERLSLQKSRPLATVASLLHGSATFVGHDSGITHLAAAAGRPTLALWGPTNPAVWQPRGPAVHLATTPDGLAHLSVEAAWIALRNLMSTHPPSPVPA